MHLEEIVFFLKSKYRGKRNEVSHYILNTYADLLSGACLPFRRTVRPQVQQRPPVSLEPVLFETGNTLATYRL